MNIRPVDQGDIERVIAVRRAVFRRDSMTPERLRSRLGVAGRRDFLAEVDGRVVGVAHAMPDEWQLDSRYAFGNAGVLPESRRRGIGTALLGAISRHAAALGASGLSLMVIEDEPQAIDYLLKRGFEESGRMQHVELDLAGAADPSPVDLTGVELRRLRAGEDAALYGAAREAEADTPLPSGEGALDLADFETWRRRTLADADLDHTYVATADGVIVGYAVMGRSRDGVAWHSMTAVRPAWRGRGVALALKAAQIRSARAAGLTTLAATNAESNPAMKRVNERLGYRAQPAVLYFRGPLQTR